MNEDDLTRDRTTGLLNRQAFLDEVRAAKTQSTVQNRRGCLLVLQFPVLKEIRQRQDKAASVDALKNLLAIIETRLRSRDTLGRIGEHSVCLLLRQCREPDAIKVAEQYGAMLRQIVIDTGVFRAPVDVHYRVISLDPRGSRSRKGLSRLVKASDFSETSKLLSRMADESMALDDQVNKVVALKDRQINAEDTGDTTATDPSSGHADANGRHIERAGDIQNESGGDTRNGSVVQLFSPANSASSSLVTSIRLKPGLLIGHKTLTGCYRVQSVSAANEQGPLEQSALMKLVLDGLALDTQNKKPLIECQLVVPLDPARLTLQSANWLKDQCRDRRIASSDLCLALRVESISQELRNNLPVLRRLNRLGISVILEGVSSAMQFTTLHDLARIDCVMISGPLLQGSLDSARRRSELDALIKAVRSQQRQVWAMGVDTTALLAHAVSLGIDIGFGRKCGRSLPFPDKPG